MHLKAEIRKEHYRAELQRLRAGLPGCGCPDCQELYSTLDLSRYGDRVSHYGDIVMIAAGRAGADIPEVKDDRWLPSGAFAHYGKKYAVSPDGTTFCIGEMGSTETAPDAPVPTPVPAKPVSKLLPDRKPPAAGKVAVMKHKHPGGRPRKEGEVSRATRWRRQKKAEQGVLV